MMTTRSPRASALRRASILWAVSCAACADQPGAPSAANLCGTPRTVALGQVQTIEGSAALDCVVLASSTTANEYLLLAANVAAAQDDLLKVRISSTRDGATAARSITPEPIAPPSLTLAGSPLQHPEVGAAFESRLRSMTRRISAGAGTGFAPAQPAGRSRSTASVTAREGDTVSFRVGDALATDMCVSYRTVRAVVRALGTHAVFAEDVAAPANGFTAADYREFAREFDDVVHPTVQKWFGAPRDVNGDGRVTLLFTPAINRLTPPGSLGYVGGYFWSPDLQPRVGAGTARCEASNEQEILYLMTPDPNGLVNGNRFTTTTVRRAMRGTVAHEYQHLINAGVRRAGAAPEEADWLDEGLSHFAEELVGRAVRGYPVSRRLVYADVLADLDDFDSFFRQNFVRLRSWMSRPEFASAISGRVLSELAPRGAAWALVRYAVDQYGGSAPELFVRGLVSGPQSDVANLEARTGRALAELLPGFLLAMSGDSTLAANSARHRLPSWALRDVMTEFSGGIYPLRIVAAVPVDSVVQAPAGSASFFSVLRPARSAPFTVRFRAEDGAALRAAGARAYLTRIR